MAENFQWKMTMEQHIQQILNKKKYPETLLKLQNYKIPKDPKSNQNEKTLPANE